MKEEEIEEMVKELSERRANLFNRRPGLGSGAEEESFEKLKKALKGDDEYIRILAEAAMGSFGGGDLSKKSDLSMESRYVRKLAESALKSESISNALDEEELIKQLSSNNRLVKSRAIMALAELGEKSIKPLIKALSNEDWSIRNGATLALGVMEGLAVNKLIEALSESDWDTRRRAARALGLIGDERAVEPLIQLLHDREKLVRLEAADALSIIGGSKSKAAVQESLRNSRKLFSKHKLF